jgi:hypothetical protein
MLFTPHTGEYSDVKEHSPLKVLIEEPAVLVELSFPHDDKIISVSRLNEYRI